jgi:cardiolipin synthase C
LTTSALKSGFRIGTKVTVDTRAGLCLWIYVALTIALSGCAALPPSATMPLTSYAPRPESFALANPEQTMLGQQLEPWAREHPGTSGFRLIPGGVGCFHARLEMAALAEKTLDVQYFSIQSDDTGRLFIKGLLDAADRGVRVRILLDDSNAVGRDAEISVLTAHPNIELRVFNPFTYRGALEFMRGAEFALNETRLTYRMHNKLFVVDNELGIVGGRNIGDAYFAASDTMEFGDYDLLVAGPMVRKLSGSFDAFWNSSLAIPLQNLVVFKATQQKLDAYRESLLKHHQAMEGSTYARPASDGGPVANMLSGKKPLIWAHAEAIYDSPEKAKVEAGEQAGKLLRARIERAAAAVHSELLIVSPYLVPGEDGMRLLTGLRARNVRVRVLTNSLESTDAPITFAGYDHYRVPMLQAGIELYEVRPQLGAPNMPGGGSLKSSQSTPFALHAKVFVFDRREVFVGSMNFDERSRRLNTELGVLVDSPELAEEIAQRFATAAQPANSYVLGLGPPDAFGKPSLIWRTEENGVAVAYDKDPHVDSWRSFRVDLLSLLPIENEL